MYKWLALITLFVFILSCKKKNPDISNTHEIIKQIEIDEKYTGIWQWRSSNLSWYNKEVCNTSSSNIKYSPLENDIDLKIIFKKSGTGFVMLNDSILNSFIVTKKQSTEHTDYFYINCGTSNFEFDKKKETYNVGDTNYFYSIGYYLNLIYDENFMQFNSNNLFVKIE